MSVISASRKELAAHALLEVREEGCRGGGGCYAQATRTAEQYAAVNIGQPDACAQVGNQAESMARRRELLTDCDPAREIISHLRESFLSQSSIGTVSERGTKTEAADMVTNRSIPGRLKEVGSLLGWEVKRK